MYQDHAIREAVGTAYVPEAMRAAQMLSWQAIEHIAAAMHPGISEGEAVALGNRILAELGMERAWHPLLIRMGEDTLKIFSDRSSHQAVLGENDIFFIDLGPVFAGHEGDAGGSFITGSDPEMIACARDVAIIFNRVRAIWDGGDGAISGRALYDAAEAEARAMGWVLHPDIKGHRVGDYPHCQGGKLGEFDGPPRAGRWILEIQIRHPTRPFGAFFEDLL